MAGVLEVVPLAAGEVPNAEVAHPAVKPPPAPLPAAGQIPSQPLDPPVRLLLFLFGFYFYFAIITQIYCRKSISLFFFAAGAPLGMSQRKATRDARKRREKAERRARRGGAGEDNRQQPRSGKDEDDDTPSEDEDDYFEEDEEDVMMQHVLAASLLEQGGSLPSSLPTSSQGKATHRTQSCRVMSC